MKMFLYNYCFEIIKIEYIFLFEMEAQVLNLEKILTHT